MVNAWFTAAVIVLGAGGLIGIAYSLDVRRRERGVIGPRLPRPGRVGRSLWWAARMLAGTMALLTLGAWLVRLPALAWAALAGFAVFFVIHTAYHIVRVFGK